MLYTWCEVKSEGRAPHSERALALVKKGVAMPLPAGFGWLPWRTLESARQLSREQFFT